MLHILDPSPLTIRQAVARLTCLALIPIALSAAWPASASASEASVRPTLNVPRGYPAFYDVVYRADPGETNDVVVSRDRAGAYDIEDRGAVIRPGASCVALAPNHVLCSPAPLSVPYTLYGTFLLLDGNDRIAASAVPGGPVGKLSRPTDTILGDTGADTISLNASPSGPRQGAPGSDAFSHGYFRGQYSVLGEEGNDTVTGSADDDIIEGGPGRDQLSGGGGDDIVAGGTGDDVVAGGAGADFLLGSDFQAFNFGMLQPADKDVLEGGPGPDLLAGGPGGDRLGGGGGRDTLLYARALGVSPRPPASLSVSFDGRANDGPRGERDNAVRPDLEGAISVGSGSFSVFASVVLKGGTYALAGGSSTSATIVTLSPQGTRRSESGTFAGSSFTVRPGLIRGPLTEISPTGGSFQRCAAGSSGTDVQASRRRLTNATIRRLRARANGHFRTKGRHSAATVRGTEWVMADRCDGTLTTVTEGTVAVRDFRRRTTVLVRAGQSYLARAGG
jgi:Ca2+-binding RTX toxin-like protein